MKNNRKSSKVQFSLFDFLNVFQKENSGSCILFVNVGSPTLNAFVR